MMQTEHKRVNFVPPNIDDDFDVAEAAPLAVQHAPVTPDTAAPITVDLQPTRSFTSVQGKPVDFYKATQAKFVLVVAVVGVTLAALFFTAWLDGYINGMVAGSGWVVMTGISGLVAFAVLNHQDISVNPERTTQKRDKRALDAWETVNVERIRAHRDVQLRAIDRHYDLLEERNEQRAKRLADKRSRAQR